MHAKRSMTLVSPALLTVFVGTAFVQAAQMGTAFTYQGRLEFDGSVVTDTCDFEFTLWDDLTAGSQKGSAVSLPGVTVEDGLFTVELDFGAEFNGKACWLQMAVCCPSTCTPATLTPRQEMTPAPHALALPGMYTQQNAVSEAPNVIGGLPDNEMTAGVVGGTISGGGSDGLRNRVTDDYGTIGGGIGNRAGDGDGTPSERTHATVGGGYNNQASWTYATVGGGAVNHAALYAATVSGGNVNYATGSFSTIPGGQANEADGNYSFAAGRRAKALHDGAFVWADSADADFSSTGTDQFLVRAAGGVGIGTSNPSEQLDVSGTVQMTAFKMPTGASNGFVLTSDPSGSGSWQPAVAGSGNTLDLAYDQGGAGAGRTINADTGAVAIVGTGGLQVFGDVGIGTASPTERLDVIGNAYVSGTINSGGVLTLDPSAEAIDSTGNLNLSTGGTSRVFLHSISGRVGIGTNTPSDSLHVVGNILATGTVRTGGFSMPTGASNGFVLTSDPSGSGSWQPAVAGSGNTLDLAYDQGGAGAGRTINADTGAVAIVGTGGLQVFGDVGIGTASPTEKLHVAGNTYVSGTIKSGAITVDGAARTINSISDLDLQTGGTSRLFIHNSSGYVGVGTVSPSSQVTVAGRIESTSGGFRFPDGSTQLSAATSGSYWGLNGNAGTTAGTHFLGTLDYEPLEMHVFGSRALRIEPTSSSYGPRLIGGYGGNTASGYGATVGGGGRSGYINSVTNNYGTVSGGYGNQADENASVGGGRENTASGNAATVGGGVQNTAGGSSATVSGGYDNEASAGSAVGGGSGNVASGAYSSVAGGVGNTATADYATVCGGNYNEANGTNSFSAGQIAKADYNGMFVWSDTNKYVRFPSTTEPNFTPAANQFLARAAGGVVFVTFVQQNGDSFSGVQLTPGGGSWSSLSDREVKANVEPVNGREILERLDRIPVSTWNYKSQDESIRHIGPMAQDLYSAFGVGEKETMITTIDADGVALAAIQGLHEVVKEKDARIADLEVRLAALEKLMKLAITGQDGGVR